MRRSLSFVFFVMLSACYDSHPFDGVLPPRDSSVDGLVRADVGPRADAGPRPDVGPRADTGPRDARMPDAPPLVDGGPGGDRCSGGETFVWILGVVEPLRQFRNQAEGFDLDDRVSAAGDPLGCFQQDFVAPDGTRGIDNQFATILPTLEGFSGPLEPLYFELFFTGAPTVAIEARHVDDLRNDDCIDVLVHRVRYEGRGDPRFDMINYAPGQLFRSFESFRYASASIAGRELTASGGIFPLVLPIAGTTAINRLRDARLRTTIAGDQLDRVVAGGSWDLDDAIESLAGAGDVPPELVRSVLESVADLDADASTGTCQSLSVAIAHLTGVDGVLR